MRRGGRARERESERDGRGRESKRQRDRKEQRTKDEERKKEKFKLDNRMRRSAELAKDRALQMLAEKRGECPFKTSCSTSTAHFQKDLTLADEKLMVMLSYRSGISWLKTPRKGETRKGNVSTKRKRAVLLHPRKSNRESLFFKKMLEDHSRDPHICILRRQYELHCPAQRAYEVHAGVSRDEDGRFRQYEAGENGPQTTRVLERNPN